MTNASDDVCDRDVLTALSRVIALYHEHAPGYSLAHFATFLTVATSSEPLRLSAIARTIGAPAPVVTVAIGHLGRHGRGPSGKPSIPPNLIDCVQHPVDARSKLAGLTPKGAELAAKMRAMLEAGATAPCRQEQQQREG
jgi:DNA-binding MarR family transcriptional regulator